MKKTASYHSPRFYSRGLLMKGVYQYFIIQSEPEFIFETLCAEPDYRVCDEKYVHSLFFGIIGNLNTISLALAPYLDRDAALLSPVERAILFVSAYELLFCRDIPYRVILNEAVEVAKRFGGLGGYKYINAVLDRFATSLDDQKLSPASCPSDHFLAEAVLTSSTPLGSSNSSQ